MLNEKEFSLLLTESLGHKVMLDALHDTGVVDWENPSISYNVTDTTTGSDDAVTGHIGGNWKEIKATSIVDFPIIDKNYIKRFNRKDLANFVIRYIDPELQIEDYEDKPKDAESEYSISNVDIVDDNLRVIISISHKIYDMIESDEEYMRRHLQAWGD